jgi:hypothetical protein
VFLNVWVRGENGTGILVGYRIRVLEIPEFSDTDTDNFIFGTDTGTIRLIHFRIRVEYGNTSTR